MPTTVYVANTVNRFNIFKMLLVYMRDVVWEGQYKLKHFSLTFWEIGVFAFLLKEKVGTADTQLMFVQQI